MRAVSRTGLRPLVTAGLLAALAFPAVAQSSGGSSTVPGMSPAVPPSYDTSAIKRRPTPIDSSGRFSQEMQACQTGRTQQARETCMEEARTARDAQRRGDLAQAGEPYTANALARCQPLSGEYKAACQARVMGFGESSGSVAGGGVLRQVETVVLPPGEDRIRIDAQTANPVILVPAEPQTR